MAILFDVIIILGLSTGIVYLCHHIKAPTVVAFLLTGILAGPSVLGLIRHPHEIDALAEVGVILLLFTIGTEFSIKSLIQLKRPALGGGGLQIGLTALAVLALCLPFVPVRNTAVLLGLMASLSSTAVALKILQDRLEINAPHGRVALSILIFQDIAAVPMILLVPILAGTAASPGMEALALSAKAAAILAMTYVLARWVLPFVLERIVRTRSRELFLFFIVALCFSVAWATSLAGLSLALGAFLAGLIISDSEYSHQALANILPFRDIFTSLFFVSMGMLLDLGFVASHLGAVATATLAVVGLKTAVIVAGGMLIGLPLRTALLAGLALCQVGEFSFILAREGLEAGLLPSGLYQLFLAVAVLSMLATPFIIAAAPGLAKKVSALPLPGWVRNGAYSPPVSHGHTPLMNDHLVIVGFGISGRNLAQAAKLWDIPYLIIDMNPRTVREERAKGEPIFYGDAMSASILELAQVGKARAVSVAVSDPVAARATVRMVREMAPKAHVVARTRFMAENARLTALGADEVVSEEFETALEVFTRVLRQYYIPRERIEAFLSEFRADGYKMLRDTDMDRVADVLAGAMPNMEIRIMGVEAGSEADGASLQGLALRKRTGVTVLTVRRGTDIVSNPDPDMPLAAGDRLMAVGQPEGLGAARNLFSMRG